MEIIKPNNHNYNYLGDASIGIADLPVRVATDPHLGRTITSAWQPSRDELAALMNGGSVELTVVGNGQPPVMLSVAPVNLDMFRETHRCGDTEYLAYLEGAVNDAGFKIVQSDAVSGRGFPLRLVKLRGGHVEMTPEDAACPILALAPAEYTYWEKQVWRRGVCDMETRGEVARAVSTSLSEMENESCESGNEECGPVEHHDSEGVPLCKGCYDDLLNDSRSE